MHFSNLLVLAAAGIAAAEERPLAMGSIMRVPVGARVGARAVGEPEAAAVPVPAAADIAADAEAAASDAWAKGEAAIDAAVAATTAAASHSHEDVATATVPVHERFTTVCTGPTTFWMGHQKYEVTEATTLTIDDCPCQYAVSHLVVLLHPGIPLLKLSCP